MRYLRADRFAFGANMRDWNEPDDVVACCDGPNVSKLVTLSRVGWVVGKSGKVCAACDWEPRPRFSKLLAERGVDGKEWIDEVKGSVWQSKFEIWLFQSNCSKRWEFTMRGNWVLSSAIPMLLLKENVDSAEYNHGK